MPGEGGTGLGADALNDVEDTGRHAGLSGDLSEEARGERRPLRWLEHHGVAGGECRTDAPGGEHERRIPRRDDRRDARGVPGDDVGVPARLELRMLQVVDGVLREETDVHGDARHDAAAVRAQERAVVAGFELGELLEAGLDKVGDTAEDLATPARAELGPAGEGLTCRGHGSIDLGGLAAGDLPEHGAVDGGEVIEGVG